MKLSSVATSLLFLAGSLVDARLAGPGSNTVAIDEPRDLAELDADGWADMPHDEEDDEPDVIPDTRHLQNTKTVRVGYYNDGSYRVCKVKFWVKDSSGTTLASETKTRDILNGYGDNIAAYEPTVAAKTQYKIKIKAYICGGDEKGKEFGSVDAAYWDQTTTASGAARSWFFCGKTGGKSLTNNRMRRNDNHSGTYYTNDHGSNTYCPGETERQNAGF